MIITLHNNCRAAGLFSSPEDRLIERAIPKPSRDAGGSEDIAWSIVEVTDKGQMIR